LTAPEETISELSLPGVQVVAAQALSSDSCDLSSDPLSWAGPQLG
jgi:hypothetical protein